MTTDIGAVADVVAIGGKLAIELQQEHNTPEMKIAAEAKIKELTKTKLANDINQEKTIEVQNDLSQ